MATTQGTWGGRPLADLNDEERAALKEWAIHSDQAPPLATLGIHLTRSEHEERLTWEFDRRHGGFY